MRLKEDDSSWRSGGIKRRDFRHDPGTPETEEMPHRRKRQRKHVKGCEHEMVRQYKNRYYTVYACKICGKKTYGWHPPTRPFTNRITVLLDPSCALEGSTWEIVERKK